MNILRALKRIFWRDDPLPLGACAWCESVVSEGEAVEIEGQPYHARCAAAVARPVAYGSVMARNGV